MIQHNNNLEHLHDLYRTQAYVVLLITSTTGTMTDSNEKTEQQKAAQTRCYIHGYTEYLQSIDAQHNTHNTHNSDFSWLNHQRLVWARFRHRFALETHELNRESFGAIWAGYIEKYMQRANQQQQSRNKSKHKPSTREAASSDLERVFKDDLRVYAASTPTVQQLMEDQAAWDELPPMVQREDGDRRTTGSSLVRWYELIQFDKPKPGILNPKYKQNILDVISQQLRSPALSEGNDQAGRNTLMFGGPGCGKSFLARMVADRLKLKMLGLSTSTFNSKMVGESEANIHAFALATKLFAPLIVFIDECDVILDEESSTGEHSKREQIEIQKHLSGDLHSTPGMLCLQQQTTSIESRKL